MILSILCDVRNHDCGLGNFKVLSTFDNVATLTFLLSCLGIIIIIIILMALFCNFSIVQRVVTPHAPQTEQQNLK